MSAVFEGLGKLITTSSADCRAWFDRGLLDSFGFQREEAIRCFRKALEFDKDCAIAHSLIAHSYAADYNFIEGLDYDTGYLEAKKACEMAAQSTSSLSDWERAFIKAQSHRFCWPVGSVPIKQLNRNYANAMRLVHEKFGRDRVDIACLYAESLMMLAPWELWTKPPNVTAAIPETLELVSLLEGALETHPTHPGLCHMYVHTMELSYTPEKALLAADELRRCPYPEQGHLLHMASHIDMRVGHYKEAIKVNEKAISVDEQYRERVGIDNDVYKIYRHHNYHFMAWAAMFDGQYSVAMRYAEVAEKQLDLEAVTCKMSEFADLPLGSTFLEAFASVPWHVLIRFGKWKEIIRRPVKEDKAAYPSTIAVAHYARGVAFAALGRLEEAEAEREKFYRILQEQTPSLTTHFLMNNPMHDPENGHGVLQIAEAVLNGEVEYHKGNFNEAFRHLALAVERDANLVYDEPWGWMVPARHSYGALLLERGRAVEAEAVYREDLEQYSENLWSLLGLSQALGLQEGRSEEAAAMRARFEEASARSDVEVGASCLCATKMAAASQCNQKKQS